MMNIAFRSSAPARSFVRTLLSLILVSLLADKTSLLRSNKKYSNSLHFVASAFTLNPSTHPGDVIEQQLAALRDGDIGTVYKFASPGNKAQTGDVSNFSRMVRSGPYRYLLGHTRSDILIESKMESSRQFLVRVTTKADSKSPQESEDDEDDDEYEGNGLYGSSDSTSSGTTKQREKIIEYWWSLSRCNSGEFIGSYMVDAVIPNQT